MFARSPLTRCQHPIVVFPPCMFPFLKQKALPIFSSELLPVSSKTKLLGAVDKILNAGRMAAYQIGLMLKLRATKRGKKKRKTKTKAKAKTNTKGKGQGKKNGAAATPVTAVKDSSANSATNLGKNRIVNLSECKSVLGALLLDGRLGSCIRRWKKVEIANR